MRRPPYSLLFAVLVSVVFIERAAAAAPPVEIEVGVTRIRHEGVRHFGARSIRDQSHFLRYREVTSFRLGYRFAEDWSIGLGYLDHGTETFIETSPDANIFDIPGIGAIQVLTPYKISQQLQETTLDVRYRLRATDWLYIETGPVLSQYQFRSTVAGAPFSETEYRLGTFGGLSLKCMDKLDVTLDYRYAHATESKMNLLSLGIRYRF